MHATLMVRSFTMCQHPEQHYPKHIIVATPNILLLQRALPTLVTNCTWYNLALTRVVSTRGTYLQWVYELGF